MSIEILQLLVSAAGLLLAAIGLPLLYVQLRDVQRSVPALNPSARLAVDRSSIMKQHLVANRASYSEALLELIESSDVAQ